VRSAGGWGSPALQPRYTTKGPERGLEGAQAIGRLSHYAQSITEALRGYTASARRGFTKHWGFDEVDLLKETIELVTKAYPTKYDTPKKSD
jgi:hypothetical protein